MLVLNALLAVVAVGIRLAVVFLTLHAGLSDLDIKSDKCFEAREKFCTLPSPQVLPIKTTQISSASPRKLFDPKLLTSITRHTALGHGITVLVLLADLWADRTIVSSREREFCFTARQSHASVRGQGKVRDKNLIHVKGRAMAEACEINATRQATVEVVNFMLLKKECLVVWLLRWLVS